MGNKVKGPNLKQSQIATALNNKRSKSDLIKDNYIKFSFRHLDTTQGATLEQWSESGILLSAINTIKNLCSSSLKQTRSIVIYGDFPKNSGYKAPSFVPEDAEWGRIHINGTHILAGHIVSDTFYIVFLDGNHSFYITEKKNT